MLVPLALKTASSVKVLNASNATMDSITFSIKLTILLLVDNALQTVSFATKARWATSLSVSSADLDFK